MQEKLVLQTNIEINGMKVQLYLFGFGSFFCCSWMLENSEEDVLAVGPKYSYSASECSRHSACLIGLVYIWQISFTKPWYSCKAFWLSQ